MRKEYSHVRSSSKIFWRARVSMISRKEKRSLHALLCDILDAELAAEVGQEPALAAELLDGDAHRHAAHAVFLRETRLGQIGAGEIIQLENFVLDFAVNAGEIDSSRLRSS